MNYIDKVLTKFRDKVLIEIPDWIYHTGKVEVRYKNPEGEWMVTEFYPGDSEPILEKYLKGFAKEIEKELEGMKLKQITIALTREQAFEAISRDIHNQTISDIITKLNQLTK